MTHSFDKSLSREEQMLAGRASDMLCSDRISFTHFLTQREQAITRQVTAHDDRAVYFGGYDSAERVMLGVFPKGTPKDLSAFPIFPLTVIWPKNTSLTHRDILGSLMSLLITRDSIGDILTEDSRAFVFLCHTAYESAIRDISKIGSVGVKLSPSDDLSSLPQQRFDERFDTVSSLRLDCIVASCANKSRSAAALLITSGAVAVNALPDINISRHISSGDKISIRGYGKMQIYEKGVSKKGRIRIEIRKYL